MSVKAWSLTTAARLSSYMGITTPTGTTLAAMEAMIDSVTEFIEKYLGRRVKKTTYTQEEYDTEASETLNLKHYPIVSGTTVTLERRTSTLNEDDWETVDSEYYHIDYDDGIIVCVPGTEFSPTRRGYRVTYTAGYDFDNAATFLSDTEGGGIELAAWMLLEAVWNKRRGGAGIQSERIGDYAITYKKILMLSDDIRALLDEYVTHDELGVITPFQA